MGALFGGDEGRDAGNWKFGGRKSARGARVVLHVEKKKQGVGGDCISRLQEGGGEWTSCYLGNMIEKKKSNAVTTARLRRTVEEK